MRKVWLALGKEMEKQGAHFEVKGCTHLLIIF